MASWPIYCSCIAAKRGWGASRPLNVIARNDPERPKRVSKSAKQNQRAVPVAASKLQLLPDQCPDTVITKQTRLELLRSLQDLTLQKLADSIMAGLSISSRQSRCRTCYPSTLDAHPSSTPRYSCRTPRSYSSSPPGASNAGTVFRAHTRDPRSKPAEPPILPSWPD